MGDDTVPFSDRFQDVYFSREDGLAETGHVFLAGNGLPARWQGSDTFTIAETGFGTGLNFLATWRAWRRSGAESSRLQYISIEKYPLERAALARAHDLFRELKPLSDALLGALDEPVDGFHRFHLDRGRLVLTLCHGDVVDMLRQLSATVDCWFLDGFAPAKNPEMWDEAVFREVARLSRPGTTFATFTVAGSVRRGLAAQGFRVEKRPGFGRKREMCAGVMERLPAYRPREPWFRPPSGHATDRHALVIGAGIAGAQVAHHLAERGWRVAVLERQPRPGLEGSGNPAAVVSPFLSAAPSLEEGYSVQSFLYLLRQLDRLDPAQRFHRRCGVLALSVDEAMRDRALRIGRRQLPPWLVRPVCADDAAALSGLATGLDGLLYPGAGWVEPAAWIRALLAHENIQLREHAAVADVVSRDGAWSAIDDAGETLAAAPVAVIASGRSMHWSPCRWIPTTPVAGQTSYLDAGQVTGKARCVVRFHGYLVPLDDPDRYLLGSTYRRDSTDATMDTTADRENWEILAADLPAIAKPGTPTPPALSGAHAAIRLTSGNRLPIAGPVPDPDRLARQYPAMLRRNHRSSGSEPVYPGGLYLSAAWGSRGMTNAALGGELLASMINDEPLPLQASIHHALHPARSLVRRLKQG